MSLKALLAVAPTALFIAAPAPVVHADGACTALAGGDGSAYDECIFKEHVYCKGRPEGLYATTIFSTCKYADGGRDECVVHLVPFSGGKVADLTCTYVPPGPEPASAPGADPS